MNEQSVQEHVYKEILKQIVDNSPNYSVKVKSEVKALIDAADTPETLCKNILVYFSALPRM